MRRSIKILLGEMDAKLTGHAALLNYRYMNLCIKAEPMSILSLIVTDIEGNAFNIEEVADTIQRDDFSFLFVPKEMEMLPFIQKGIAETHPEFKQEVIKPEGDDHYFYPDTPEYDEERHLVCTMPEVDDNRYDALKQSVKALYDERKVEMDKIKAEYTQTIADRTAELPKDEADEAKNRLEELCNQYSDLCKQYRDNKEEEIEEAHQNWLVNQAEDRLNRLHSNPS
jgi:ribosome recycling factor